MHATCREAVYQQCNQPGRQAMSIALCCRRLMSALSGPPRFATLIACISIQHAPGAQGKTESNWTSRRYAGKGGEGYANKRQASLELTAGIEQRNCHTVHCWSNSAPLSRQNHLRLISDAWIWISKGWKTNTNSNLKFEVRKAKLRLTILFRSLNVGLNCNVAYNFYATMGSKRLAVAECPVA